MIEQNTIPDSWEARIEQFSKIIGMTVDTVETALSDKNFELTKDTPYVLEMLSDETITPFGDFRKIFCDDRGISLPKLRLGIKYIRGSKELRAAATSTVDPDLMNIKTKYGIDISIEDLSVEELIPNYDPSKTNAITKALQKQFGDKKVIAFIPDTKKIAIEETINYIVDINDGLPEEEAIEVNGELVRLYEIGKVPNEMINEDPLYVGVPLKRGRSVVNRIDWNGIEQSKRQFARILLDKGEIDPADRMHVRQLIIDLNERFSEFRKLYPEAYMVYKELERKNELPKLQLSLDSCGKKNNPFSVNRRY
jgi:hypothetical protein